MQALTGVFLITFIFGIIYMILDKANPKRFGFKTMIDPLYFSFATMSSVGFGDFSPKTDIAKLVVMVQQGILIGEIINLLGFEPNTSFSNLFFNNEKDESSKPEEESEPDKIEIPSEQSTF